MPGRERELRMETRSKRRKLVGDVEDASVCRLTDMAPEVVCMLVVWTKARVALELRATCRTLKRAAAEVVPWMIRRRTSLWSRSATEQWGLAVTDMDATRRMVLHVPGILECYGNLTVEMAALMGNLEVVKFLREKGCCWNKWTCLYARRSGCDELIRWVHSDVVRTWPCINEPCEWVRDRKLAQ